jgi:hypothetical protein
MREFVGVKSPLELLIEVGSKQRRRISIHGSIKCDFEASRSKVCIAAE